MIIIVIIFVAMCAFLGAFYIVHGIKSKSITNFVFGIAITLISIMVFSIIEDRINKEYHYCLNRDIKKSYFKSADTVNYEFFLIDTNK